MKATSSNSEQSQTFFKIVANLLTGYLFKEKLHRHLSAEGRDPWHTRKHRTHWHCNPTHQRSLRDGLAGLCRCLWLNHTQASGTGPDQIPRPREDLKPPGLLQQL